MKWIDIHRHTPVQDPNVITLVNLDKDFQVDPQLPSTNYFSTGIHPWWIQEIDIDQALEKMKSLSLHKSFLCFGEMGLDLAVKIEIKTQVDVFEKQLNLAKVHSPEYIVIHSVRAYNEILGAVKRVRYEGKLIFHDFNASSVILSSLVSQGHLLSFGRHLFSEETKAYKLFNNIPVENIILETDDSSEVVIEEVYKQAAQLREMDINVLKEKMQLTFSKILAARKN